MRSVDRRSSDALTWRRMIPRVFSALLILLLLALPAGAQKPAEDKVQFGRSINIAPGESAGDIVCIGCAVTMHGAAQEVVAIGGSADIDGRVNRDVTALGGRVVLGPNAVVGSDVTAVGGNIRRDPAAVVRGEVTAVGPALRGGLSAAIPAFFLGSLLFFLPVSVILALLCYAIAGQRRIDSVAGTLGAKPGITFLAGIAVIFAGIVLSIVLARIRPVGGVLVFFLWIAIFLASILGYTGVSAMIGRHISRSVTPLAVIVIGAAIVAVLESIPLIGFVFSVIFGFFALGGAALSGYGTSPDWIDQRLGPRPPRPPTAAAGQ